MGFSQEQVKLLSAKLEAENVKQREQAGRKLSYIEGWHTIAEANRIFGYDAWSRETLDVNVVAQRERKIGKGQYEKDGWGVTYTARVRVVVNGLAREGWGAGHGIDADLGQAHESAIKEAETDAMKRALMTFGNPFGLALYDKEQTNVAPKQGPNEIKSINFANGYVLVRFSAVDKLALDKENKAKIDYAARYPEARRILVEAGILI
jgi:DNA recombination protein Rad52